MIFVCRARSLHHLDFEWGIENKNILNAKKTGKNIQNRWTVGDVGGHSQINSVNSTGHRGFISFRSRGVAEIIVLWIASLCSLFDTITLIYIYQ